MNDSEDLSRFMPQEPDPRGLGYQYFHCMKKNKYATAQIDAQTGQTDTYGALLERCIRTALAMKDRGIEPGDIITLCSYNHLNSIVPFIASLFLGCQVSSLDPTISLQDCSYLISQIKPKLIFASPNAEKLMENVLEDTNNYVEIVVFGSSFQNTPFADFLTPCDGENEFEPYETENIRETGVIFFSSGTTGMPKGICTSHYALYLQATIFRSMGFESDRTLSYASLYWISSALLLTNCVLSGTCRIVCSQYDPKLIWRLIDKYKISLIFLSPNQAILMYKAGRPENITTASLLDLIIGGGPLCDEYILKLREVLPGSNVVLAYGQTEVAGLLTAFKPASRKDVLLLNQKPGSCGRILPGVEYKLVDLGNEEEVDGPHKKGELRIKSPLQMNGYYNKDSSESFDADGWLKTGDVAYYDEDHCIYIVDRIKEMLKYQSWHVPPALIEAVLLSHPAVHFAVVIGIPHPEDGDHPMGVVILNEESKDISEDDLVEYVNSKVDDRQKLRAGVKFVKEFPHTPTGKVKRKQLKDLILAGEM